MAFVNVPSLLVNVSVPVHCDVEKAADVVGVKVISCAINTRDKTTRTVNDLIVFLISHLF